MSSKVVEGFEVLEAMVEVNGCDIFYQKLGDGPPLVFVHGGMVLDSSNFLPHVAPLAKDLSLIIYDQAGRGRSGEREDISNITIMDDVDDLDGLRKALGIRTWTVAGHSWGGIIGGLYAWRYPEALDRLIMIAPVGSHYPAWQRPWVKNTLDTLPPEYRDRFEKVLKDKELRRRDPKGFFQRYFSSIHPAWFADQTWADRIPVHKVRARTGGAVWDSLRGYDFRDRFRMIDVPTLIIQGDKDAIPRSSTEEIEGLVPGSRTLWLKDVGHYPFIEAREMFITAVVGFHDLGEGPGARTDERELQGLVTFVRDLGCGCPDEVFESIRHEHYQGRRSEPRIIIGERLVVHLHPVDRSDESGTEALVQELVSLFEDGRALRDSEGHNRFRLVLVPRWDPEDLSGLVQTSERALDEFQRAHGPDEKVHVHVVRRGQVPAQYDRDIMSDPKEGD